MPHTRSLILLTGQYPHAEGDAVFVEAEIQALARHFDRIYIWTSVPSAVPFVASVPSNVQLMGSISDRNQLKTVLRALGPSLLRRFVSMVVTETRERHCQVRLGRLIRSAAVAVVGGHHLQQRIDLIARRGHPLVIYSFWGTDGALVLTTMKYRPAYCAVRLHGYDLYEDRVGYLPFRRRLFEATDALLTVSAHGARYLEQNYANSLELPPIHVARLGTTDHGVGPRTPASVVRVVSCSSLIRLKRVDLILRVLDHFARDHVVEWTHFGDGPMRVELEALAERVNPNLHICLRGRVTNQALMAHYQSEPVSVFVNLSTTEGLPVSIMEALSFDVPVLATDVGGTSEIVGEKLNSGMLVPAGASVQEIAGALGQLLEPNREWRPRAIWEDVCSATKNGETVARLLATSTAPGRKEGERSK